MTYEQVRRAWEVKCKISQEESLTKDDQQFLQSLNAGEPDEAAARAIVEYWLSRDAHDRMNAVSVLEAFIRSGVPHSELLRLAACEVLQLLPREKLLSKDIRAYLKESESGHPAVAEIAKYALEWAEASGGSLGSG